MRLSIEVQRVIRANLLPRDETIAYLRQCVLSRFRSYSNVRSADFCLLMLALGFLFNANKRYYWYAVSLAETNSFRLSNLKY